MLILTELFVTDLLRATSTQFKSDRQQKSNQVNVISVKFTPSYNRNTLLCVARTQSSNSTNKYITKIELQNVVFVDENSESTTKLELTGSDNRKFFIEPQSRFKCNVRLNCNCLDFYQRMASYNKSNKVLVGRKVPTHYQSPTTPENKEKGNPNNSPGMCKHLIALYDNLVTQGLIT